MELKIEDLMELARLERQMSSGEIPHVVFNGERWAMTNEVMNEMQLEAGQTVSSAIMETALRLNIKNCQKKLQEQAIENLKPSDFDENI